MPPRNSLSLKDKISVINFQEKERLSVRDIAKRFNIRKTQSAEILKNKEVIKEKWQSGINVHYKKNRLTAKGSQVDKLCYDWFTVARSKNIPISGPIVKTKAKEIAELVGYSGFCASDGWLQKWRNRHNITFKCISGESSDVSSEDVNQFRAKLPSMLSQYRPEDLYNADESGLFFRALPDKTLALKSERRTGGKLSKERLIILFCVNMVGQKETLLLIGKAARPRAFKHIPITDLPVDWKSNKKAWMTREIMSEWLHQLDKKMRSCNRKILLFLDNAASHPKELSLTNITVSFLPANTTSVCQPLDQGIIQNFKVNYRSLILKHVISKMQSAKSASEVSKSINVLDALCFIKTAWDKVETATIKNCFRKSGFMVENPILLEFDPEDDIPLSTPLNFRALAEHYETDLEDFLIIDSVAHTENDNIEINLENINNPEEILSDSEENVVVQEIDSIKSYEEALKQIVRLKAFAIEDFVAYEQLTTLESHFEGMERNGSFQPKQLHILLLFKLL